MKTYTFDITSRCLATLTGALVLVGCADDTFLTDSNNAPLSPDVVAFAASVGGGESRTRSVGEKQLYEPLVLTDDARTMPLYLHTYEAEQIGLQPGESSSGDSATRGAQVESASALASIHKDFIVNAAYSADNMATYFAWQKAEKVSDNAEIWRPTTTQYWPGTKNLAFHAVAPASELSALQNLSITPDRSTFTYTAKKGSAGQDAEAQTDLLLAMSQCDKAGSDNGRAPLNFQHPLSAIKFAVRDVLNGEVVSISIKGIYGKGDCVYADDGTGRKYFSWSGQDEKTDYTQNFNYALNDRYGNDYSVEANDLVLNDAMPTKTFMVIPQPIPEDAEIVVRLKRNVTGVESDITVKGKIKANNVKEWEPGHEYIYTISTSADNWIYVLKATGNHKTSNGNHNVDGDQIYVYSPSAKEHDTYGDNAYFKVTSYRYCANNHNHTEALPWSASHGGAKQYRPIGYPGEYVTNRDLSATDWIKDPAGLKGNGGTTAEKHDLSFAVHNLMTDWPGDKWMQDENKYSGNSESNPWDLSTCGGKVSRTTANCYVVDREGWYAFPLIYGNAITAGSDNQDAYKFNGTKGTLSDGKYLDAFKDYNGNNITAPQIPADFCKSAGIVWADLYNAISDVSLKNVGNEKMIVFKANKYNLQQGSVILALYDASGTVVWSWHIWITEHWLNPANGRPHARNTGATNGAFDFNESASGWRNRGDVQMTAVDQSSIKYHVAPYNLGWCDPKNVDYLRRPETMNFVQYEPDGVTPSKLTASLSILQEGCRIEYKYGNNTYYQWGRKDAIVGFVDHSSNVKRNFGPKQYELGNQKVGIATAIKNPQVLYTNSSNTDISSDDWCSTRWINLWNNTKKTAYVFNAANRDGYGHSHVSLYHSSKTIYDPCPPGYMVPPAGVWKIVGKCDAWITKDPNTGKDVYHAPSYVNSGSTGTKLEHLNGSIVDRYTFKIWASSTHNNANSLWLTSTGNRWYTSGRNDLCNAGGNFNPQIVYLWSSTPVGTTGSYMAYGLALGNDVSVNQSITANKYVSTPFFYGRRSMARPVRPIREAYTGK